MESNYVIKHIIRMENLANKRSITSSDIENYSFNDIFEISEVQKLQNLFAKTHGVASIITDTLGNPITEPSNFTHLCQNIIRKTEKGCSNCYHSDAILGRYHPSGAVIQPCLSGGLWDAGVSITLKGKHIANWLIGQVRNEYYNEKQLVEYAKEIGADVIEYIKAYKDVPIMSAEKLYNIAELLFVFANHLSEKAQSNIMLNEQIYEKNNAFALLNEREENLSTTFNSIGDGVITTDCDGLITQMNPIAEKLCGWKLSDAKSLALDKVFQLKNLYTRKDIVLPLNEVLQNNKTIELPENTVLISKSGYEYIIADSAAPIKNKQGETNGMVLVFNDISEKYKIQRSITENEKRFRGLLNNFEAAIVVYSPTGTPKICNIRATDLFQLNSEQQNELQTIAPWHFVDEQLSPIKGNQYPVSEIFNSKKAIINKILGLKKINSNNITWLSVNGYPALNENNDIDEIIISYIDISESKITSQQLAESKKHNEDLINSLDGIVWEADCMLKKFSFVSNQTLTMLGYTTAEWCEEDFWINHVVDSDKSIALDYCQNLKNKNFQPTFEYRFLDKNGKTVWLQNILNTSTYNDTTNIIKGITLNISKLKEADQALKKNEELYKLLYFSNPMPMSIYDSENLHFLSVNDSFVEKYGYRREELMSMTIMDLQPKTEIDKTLQSVKQADNGLTNAGIFRHKKKNNEIIFVEIIRHSIDYEGKQAKLVLVHDITNRKLVEDKLHQSKLQLQEFASHLQQVREDERSSLAREIHDSVAQYLVALKMNLGVFKKQLLIDEANKVNYEKFSSEIDNFIVQVDNANTATRRIMNGLRPIQLEILGFIDATETFLIDFEKHHHIKCNLEVNGVSTYNFEPNLALSLYRILQESLSNILKHAKATIIDIKISKDTDYLTMEINDNGIGFCTTHKGRDDSYGIIGMKERANIINAKLNIESVTGKGTNIILTVPLN